MSSSGIGESRTDLLNWLNELLHLNYRKVEQCGTGAAYCQILDSIYGDIPMGRVKFDENALEYEYQTNYKILQSCLSRHKVEKTIYVEKLIRCKFQDNLEFLQWIKKFWVQNQDGSPYDPESRRRFKSNSQPSSRMNSYSRINSNNNISSRTTSRKTSLYDNNSNNNSNNSLSVTKRRTSNMNNNSTTNNLLTNSRSSSLNIINNNNSNSSINKRMISNEQINALQSELNKYKKDNELLKQENQARIESLAVFQNERDFYFGKLRDIEIYVCSTLDLLQEGSHPTGQDEMINSLTKIQQILYASAEGFSNSADLETNENNNNNNNTTNDNVILNNHQHDGDNTNNNITTINQLSQSEEDSNNLTNSFHVLDTNNQQQQRSNRAIVMDDDVF